MIDLRDPVNPFLGSPHGPTLLRAGLVVLKVPLPIAPLLETILLKIQWYQQQDGLVVTAHVIIPPETYWSKEK